MTLAGIDVSAEPGEFIALVGPSGSGQVDDPQALAGVRVTELRDRDL